MKKIVSAILLTAMLLMCLGTAALAAGSIYISGNCYMRSGPASWYESISGLNKGSYVTYLGDSTYSDGGTWYKVQTPNGNVGWVSAKYASISGSGGIATYNEGGQGNSVEGYESGSFAYGSSVYISGKCNVRYGPSLSSQVKGAAYKGDVLMGTGRISTDSRGIDWYSVSYKNGEYWVSSVYASINGGTYSSSSTSSSSGYSSGTVVGTSGDSNLRTGPGLGYSKTGYVLHQGASATFLGDTSVDGRGIAWYRVSYAGITGWVSSMYTTLY